MSWFDQPEIILAVITSLLSLVTAGVTAVFSRKNETRLKYLENKLATERAEKDARRDYEYDARKRLYQQCEPILFQFMELSESSLRRIYALARNAREGNLGPDRFWLSTDHYFIRSTIYRLLAPMAAFRILQSKLTGVDLKLDQGINIQYQLAKILYYTFSSSTDLAKAEPAIPYDPDQIESDSKNISDSEKKEKRRGFPEKYWLQGLKVGKLDTLVECFIAVKDGSDYRIKSFGEFEQEFFNVENKSNPLESNYKNNTFEVLLTLFSFFHPRKRPVLWRILITQAYLYDAIMNIRSNTLSISPNSQTSIDPDKLKILFNVDKTKLECNWKQSHDEISSQEFEAPFIAAENYLSKQLSYVSLLK